MKNVKYAVILTAGILVFFSCSSAPKNSGDIDYLRTNAESLLASGNVEASQGRYGNALTLINESKRNAILTDDASLIIRSSLARGNVLIALGSTDEAFVEWEQALREAQRIGDSELVSVCRVFIARGNLFSDRASAQSVLNDVNREAVNIKTDRQYLAFSMHLKGLALRALGSYRDAEIAVTQSLEINEKDKSLENASYDWYTIASIRSLAGNADGALKALESSMAIDRRIENSWGLAASWRAMGDVYRKAANAPQAEEAYRRAAAIYTAMGNEIEAAEIAGLMEN